MIDFTAPDTVVGNIESALEAGVPCIVGTSGWETAPVEAKALEAGLPVFYAPNFAIGAVLMMRFAAEAAKHIPRAEIVELHHETKVDAPSGTAKATAEAMGGDVPIHSVRLPGIVAHQEVLLSRAGRAADDPPRRVLPRGVRPRRPARPRALAGPRAWVDNWAREPVVSPAESHLDPVQRPCALRVRVVVEEFAAGREAAAEARLPPPRSRRSTNRRPVAGGSTLRTTPPVRVHTSASVTTRKRPLTRTPVSRLRL